MSNRLLSVILLSYYSNKRIISAYEKINRIFELEKIPFELIIIDDGSEDESFAIAEELEIKCENVFAYQLSKNYSSNYAGFAGLSVCNGECVVIIPDDEQQPYSSIIEMYRLWEHGEKLIIPYRNQRIEKGYSKYFSLLFYKIMNALSEIKYPPGGADLFFADREVIDILISKIKPINTALIPEVLRLGYSPYYFPYTRPQGLNENGKSRWSFRKKVKLAKDTFYSSSTFPIRMIKYIGQFFSTFSFIAIIFYLYITFFGNNKFWGIAPPGWTSTVLIICFFSGLILLSLGIIAEYIWRIYEEVKNRPGYIIKKKNR
ncbi:MAG: glycosyltransferase [Salinivirgaceae bacterium]|jgi:dolichol-phosphate mannosyltransferase